jgi:CzcA family heavy metal efflux pump
MKPFLRWLLDHPMVTALFFLVAGMLGLYGGARMPVNIFPKLSVPIVNIITHDPGAAPQDVELLISRPIGSRMRGIDGVQRVKSTSFVGVSVVTVQFDWDTSVQQARQLVTARLARVRGTLPQGVVPRIESIGTTLQEVLGYVVYGGDPVALRRTVEYSLGGRLMDVPGVSRVEVLGGDRRAFVIHVSPAALTALHMSIGELVSLVQADNRAEIAGYLDRSSREYLIRGNARLMTLEDIRNLPIKGPSGRTVLLGDVARVKDWRAPRHYSVYGNGEPAVAFFILKQPGASTLKVAGTAGRAVEKLKALLPPGAQIHKFYDQSEMIGQARREIIHDLLLGALLAVLVLFFFMGRLGPTLVVAATIPITMLATLAVMSAFHQGLNMITMSALALGIGMFVDDAIVVSENIYRHRLMGTNGRAAAIEGAAEIAGPDASGTFTTVAAFLPLVLVTGLAGVFLKPFGLTISAGLLASLLISLTFVPLAFSRMRIEKPPDGFAGVRALAEVDGLLQRTLRYALQRRKVVLILSAAVFAAGGCAVFFIRDVALLPPIDEGSLLIEYRMPHGTSLPEMDRVGRQLESIALEDPDVTTVYLRVGAPSGSLVVDPINRGELDIKLRRRGRLRTADAITARLRRAYSGFHGVIFLYHQPTQENMDESFSGLPALFGVTVFGPDLSTLTRIASQVQKILNKDPAIAGVVNETQYPVPEVVVRVRYPQLGVYGVKASDLLDTLKASRLGVSATQVVHQREIIPVIVKMDPGEGYDPYSIGALKRLPVPTRDGGFIPLEKLADVEIRNAPAALTRLNGQREVTLITDVGGSIPGMVSRLRKRFERIRLPAGYEIAFSGQYSLLVKTAEELGFAVLLAMLLIYFIMVLQFKSWIEPLIILLTVPLSLVGAAAALAVAGRGLDVSVGMGVLTLAGISVNNAIVLMEYANRERVAGAAPHEALLTAATVRLRPILMTAFTTIFALAPAAITTATGSRVFQPFAITVLGGLLSGTLATLVIVPTLASYISWPRRTET